MSKLTSKGIDAAGPGSYSDGLGLLIKKRSKDSGRWILRYQLNGKRRDLGLGAWPDLSLKQARELAGNLRAQIKQGIDPLAERERLRTEAARGNTLADMIDATFEALQPTLKGGGEAGRWMSPLRTHVIPAIGHMHVEQVTGPVLRDCLREPWQTAPEASKKALRRVGIVMRHAAAEGLNVDLQASERARHLLGAQVRQVQHIPAMAWQAVPEFYASLGATPVEAALKLLILTAVRSGSIRLAQTKEFDLDAGVWTIPAAHQKGRIGQVQDMRVPLSAEAVRVVREATEGRKPDDIVCPARRGQPMSDMAMSMFMRRADLDARPHGFRSSFRDWASETSQDWAAAETSLGHAIGTRVERSYARSDLLDQRRVLLDKWSQLVTGASGQVVQLRR